MRGTIMEPHKTRRELKVFLNLIQEAICHLYANESLVVRVEANERCMAAHVFAFLKWNWPESLNGFNIDYEYNREGLNGDSKKLLYRQPKEIKASLHDVIPDMVVHVRGDTLSEGNLFVIEFKKPDVDLENDIAKLKAMTNQGENGKFKYAFGFHIIFGQVCYETALSPFVNGQEGKLFSLQDIDNNLQAVIDTILSDIS